MGMGRGYINGISFDMIGEHDDAHEIHSTLGTYEIWEIVNQSGMDHPFHQHVNACQVLSITGGDAGVRLALHLGARLEGRGDRAEVGQRADPGAGDGLRRA